MDDRHAKVRARISLLPDCLGSRQGLWRPNHNFLGPDDREMAIGQIAIPEGTVLRPGDSIEQTVSFFHGPRLDGLIVPGREWRIQEGCRLVGMGVILKILS